MPAVFHLTTMEIENHTQPEMFYDLIFLITIPVGLLIFVLIDYSISKKMK